ncbi:hypothetical protein CDAR_606171 [Caerostris darwini]|uniref:Uncharacterized protein n=1 Tax=Caerostris darwini TaxID=1538125 RepID=A0AAV4NPV0_9ARAC|nr:hypothetical protein CDAR_606171 [Caerostris darwini]
MLKHCLVIKQGSLTYFGSSCLLAHKASSIPFHVLLSLSRPRACPSPENLHLMKSSFICRFLISPWVYFFFSYHQERDMCVEFSLGMSSLPPFHFRADEQQLIPKFHCFSL